MGNRQPNNPQSEARGGADPPAVNDRPGAAQPIGQASSGLSAAVIHPLVAMPIGLILACLAICLLTGGG